jgi:hypothetical protein
VDRPTPEEPEGWDRKNEEGGLTMGALACAFSWDTLPSTVLAATGTRAIERDMMRVVVGGGVEVEEFGE